MNHLLFIRFAQLHTIQKKGDCILNPPNRFRKKLLFATAVFAVVILILIGAFLFYASDYYRAEDMALEVLAQGQQIETKDNLTILTPGVPSDTAVIFLPGCESRGDSLPSSFRPDPPARHHMYLGRYAVSHGNF